MTYGQIINRRRRRRVVALCYSICMNAHLVLSSSFFQILKTHFFVRCFIGQEEQTKNFEPTKHKRVG